MKHFFKPRFGLAALLCCCAVLIQGCTAVDYSQSVFSQDSTPTQTQPPEPTDDYGVITENSLRKFKINPVDYKEIFEAETLVDTEPLTDIGGHSGDGYIGLYAYDSVKLSFSAVSSQFYNIKIYACGDGGAVSLTLGGSKKIPAENGGYSRIDGDVAGAYRVPQSDVFTAYTLCPVYIEQGAANLTLQTVSGGVYIDRIEITDTDTVSGDRYSGAEKWISGSGVNDGRQALMNYFKSIYGKQTLTAQYCTPNTNAEIDVIRRNTGRFPAIRCGDLMYYTNAGSTVSKEQNKDVQLAVEWAQAGGIVSYSWYWYAPVGKATFYAKEAEFDASKCVSRNMDAAMMSDEELQLLLENESITEECYAVLHDIDSIARQLQALQNAGVTVLFRPMPCTMAGWYWWECDAETYKWLWQTMHRRLDKFYDLSNIIWVCSVTDAMFFPGEDFIDIMGCDVYNNSKVSNLAAMLQSDSLLLSRRMLALSECCFAPDPDIMYRDNAMWLWCAPWCGDYLINENGDLNGNYISVNDLKKVYNHELTITRDELDIQG